MKKLMVAFAAVALTVSAQAATCYLKTTTKSPDAPALTKDTMSGYSCYFVTLNGMKGGYLMDDDTLTVTDVAKVTSYLQGNFDSAWNTFKTVKGIAVPGASMYWDSNAMTTYTSNESYTGDAFAVFAYDNPSTKDEGFTNFRVVSLNGNKSGSFKEGSAGSKAPIWGNWTAVPEPTSGLLLLLGVAGLCLRRKQK